MRPEAESTALGRRGSDRAQGCRCRRPFLGNTVSPHPGAGSLPPEQCPALASLPCSVPPVATALILHRRRLRDARPKPFLPPGPLPMLCPLRDVPFLLSSPYLLVILKSLSSGLASSKNPSMILIPTHTPARIRCHSSMLISADTLITYYNLPNKYLLSVCLPWASL